MPEALNNYMASLGWAAENGKEIMSMDELIKNFKLESVVSAAANFDFERLKWVNQKHIAAMPNDAIARRIIVLCPETKALEKTKFLLAIGLVKDRAETILDFWGLMKYLFYAPEVFEEKDVTKLSKKTKQILKQIEKIVRTSKNETMLSTGEEFVERSLDWANKNSIKSGQMMMAFRLALVGGLHGIDLKKIISFIGVNETSSRFGRLRKALD